MKKMRILLSALTLIAFQAHATIDLVDFTPSTVCEGSQTVFTSTSIVSGGVTITDWNWDLDADGLFDNATGPSINHQFNAPGTYNVGLQIITDGAETASRYILITVNPIPTANFSAPDVCQGTASTLSDLSTIITGTITGWGWDLDNDGLYDNASDSSVVHDFVTPGSYTVGLQVTSDLGCQSTTAQNLTIDPMPTVGFTVSSVCLGDQTEFNAVSSVSSGLVTDYNWELNGNGFFDDASGQMASTQFISDGDYQIGLQVISDQGCAHDTFQLVTIAPFPYVNFSFDNACQNTEVQFTNLTGNVVGTISYDWSFGITGSSTDENPSYTFTGAGPTVVQLIGLTSYGCADTLAQTIQILPTPEADFSFTEICNGLTTDFTNTTDPKGSTIDHYFWDYSDGNVDAGSDPFHQFAVADSFLVTLIAYTTDGCRDTVQHYVNVWPLPTPAITPNGSVFFCDGDSVSLTVDPIGNPTLWSTGEASQTITVDTTGIYQVTVIDDHGCQGQTSMNVYTWLLPELTISNDTTISLGEVVPLWVDGASTYEWVASTYLDDAFSASPNSRPKENVTYTVTGTDVNGCQSTIDVTINVDVDYLLKPVNLFTPNGDGVNETFFIENIECYADCNVKVYNRWGVEVYSGQPYINLNKPLGSTSASNAWDGRFNGDPLPEGTYYYVIECDGKNGRFDGPVSILRNKK